LDEEMKMENAPICQSCAMPMEKPEDFGTDKDGSRNGDYCHFCFGNGEFINKGITLEQMIEKLAGFSERMGMTEEQGREMARKVLPTLKRWKQ
jgi:hypothetical protein